MEVNYWLVCSSSNCAQCDEPEVVYYRIPELGVYTLDKKKAMRWFDQEGAESFAARLGTEWKAVQVSFEGSEQVIEKCSECDGTGKQKRSMLVGDKMTVWYSPVAKCRVCYKGF
jgi:hypothetical protein